MRPRAPEAYLGEGLQFFRHDALDGPPAPCNIRDNSDYIKEHVVQTPTTPKGWDFACNIRTLTPSCSLSVGGGPT